MADITDVMNSIIAIVDGAIYPNGDGQPSAMPGGTPVRIGRGWPLPAALDADLAAGTVQITVYPLSGAATPTYQILDKTYTITPPAITTTVAVSGDVVTVSGSLSLGEFLTLVVDDAVVCSQSGANVAAMLSALAAQATSQGIVGASATSTALTIPFNRSLVVRQGGQALMGKVTHRQRHSIMVCVWAPSDDKREAAAILAVETVQPGRVLQTADGLVTVAIGEHKLTALAPDLPPATLEVHVCIRAEDVILMRGDPGRSSPRNCFHGRVQALQPDGPMVRVELDRGFSLTALLTRQACQELELSVGEQVLALVKAPQIHLIPRTASV